MILSSSHDHGPVLSFFKLPRSGASLIIYSSSGHDHGPALSFFSLFYTATITGQFYHFLKQPRSRVCVIIFFNTATITGQFCHFLKQPRSRACVIIFFLYTASITGQISPFHHAASITSQRIIFKQPRSRACIIM